MGRIVLTNASYTARSLIASAQRCINLYAELNPANDAAPMTFYGTPGKVLVSTLPTAPVRCLYKASNGTLFAVGGSVLYRYVAGAWVSIALLSTFSGPVCGADNGVSAVFTDGSKAAPTVNLTTFAAGAMSGDGWYGADFVTFLDGFLIFNKPGTQQFYITGALDLTLDALDFASAESVPDLLVRVMRDHNEIWMFGQSSTEVFANGGNALFPFERVSGSTMDVGCAAPHSVAQMDNSMFWLGADKRGTPTFYRAAAGSPTRIATHALEEELRTYARLDDAEAFSYQDGGHSFYVVAFPAAGKTWAYDASTQLWAERSFRGPLNSRERDRASCHAYHDGKHLVGDWESGNIYQLDLDAYTDNGAEIVRVKSFQHMTADNRRQFFTRLVLDMQAGVGNDGDADPLVNLRWSDDGGHTWGAMMTSPLGQVGEYLNKPVFNRLGSGRDRVFEVSTSINAKLALQGAFVDAKVGT